MTTRREEGCTPLNLGSYFMRKPCNQHLREILTTIYPQTIIRAYNLVNGRGRGEVDSKIVKQLRQEGMIILGDGAFSNNN